ncbi:MAG: TRAM domain-containing protein [Clostridia bacterium]|nr:TRAM domain-containing protein [Clostridia bacterium]
MQVGDILTVEITSIGMDGEGVAKVDGLVLFIPGTLVGETAKVQITQVKKSFCFAKVIKILVASPDRERPSARYALSAAVARICTSTTKSSLKSRDFTSRIV